MSNVISNSVERLIQEQGWNDSSVISLLYRFIEKEDLSDELEDFLQEQAEEENGEDDNDEEKVIHEQASTLSRDVCIRLLEGVGIQCYDHESDAVLREAVAVNVLDGTIDMDDFDVGTL